MKKRLVLGLAALSLAFQPSLVAAESHEQVDLQPGERITSPNGQQVLVHQHDGNVVLYSAGKAVWQTKTVGRDTDNVVFQSDGNFVVYGEGRALWHTGTYGKGQVLAVQDDANLVVYGTEKPVWASRGLQQPKPFRSNGTPDQNRHLGLLISQQLGWPRYQFDCANAIWNQESGWNHTIYNRQGSGAYGIPQALPGSKMGSHGSDWRTNPETQIRWGYDYMVGRYGSACKAHAFKMRNGWY